MSLLIGASSPAQGASGAQGAAADLGDTIDQSLRFRGSQKLTCSTIDTTTGSTSGTISVWYKRGYTEDTSIRTIYNASNNGGSQLNPSTNSVNFRVPSHSTAFSSLGGQLRDQSAWYHVVTSYDSNTTNLWINGELFGTSATQADNVLRLNATCIIGCAGTVQFFEGYLAEFIAVEGQVLDEEDFGKYNEDGVWVPIEYTGTYGTNGFHLTFDSSQANGIGHDSSGNSNHFTASNFDTAAISSSNFDNDIDYFDTPTSNFSTLNSIGGSHQAPTFDANLNTTSSSSGWNTAYGTCEMTTGKYYWEIENTANDGSTGTMYGVANYDQYVKRTTADSVGADANGGGYYSDSGQKVSSNNFASYGASFTSGDIIGIAFDADTKTLWAHKNGTWQNSATQSEVENGTTTNSMFTGMTGDRFLPGISTVATTGRSKVNFGQRDFVYTAPSGYSKLQTNNLPEPTIKNGKEHFDVVTYTGNGSTQSITSLEFQPDFVWLKSRNVGYHNRLFDVIRGQSSLVSDDARAEGTSADSSLTSFDSNGFSITQTVNESYNQSTKTYVAWCWKAGGTAVSNTDGTITSSVSANTDAGFSIVSYTGVAPSTGTVGHGLSSAPECVLVKDRSSSTFHWQMWHTSLSSADHSLLLNQTTAEADYNSWQNTAPTNSVVSLGAVNGVNTGSNNYIMYCWHSVEGYSKFGSYTGNGSSTDGPFVYTGFEVHWLLVKRTNAATNWVLYDTKREPVNPNDVHLFANLTNAENTSTSFNVDLLSNGFKIRGNTSNINASGGNYIYMAFGAHPFGGENAPPATAR